MSFIKNSLKKILPSRVYFFLKETYRYVDSLRYLGNNYECIFCKGQFSIFLPAGVDVPILKEYQVVGGGYRLNSTCPRCFSSDRERLIYLYLKEIKNSIFSKNIKLLHVAPERQLSRFLKACRNIEYISADLHSPHVDIKMDIVDIKEANETYDVIICNHVLEHIQEDTKAMSELYRVLKKGGIAILQVPISYQLIYSLEDNSITNPQERKIKFGQKDHVRIYGLDYIERLKKAGFSVIDYDYSKKINPEIVLKYALLPEERVFVCSKT